MRRVSLAVCIIMLCGLCGCMGYSGDGSSATQWVLDGTLSNDSIDRVSDGSEDFDGSVGSVGSVGSDGVSDVDVQISALDAEVSDLMSDLVVYGERTQKWVNFLRSDRYTVRYSVVDGGTGIGVEHGGDAEDKRELIVVKDGNNFAYRYTEGIVRYFQVDGVGHFIDDARKYDVVVERALVSAEDVAYSLDLKYEGTDDAEIDGVKCICERHQILGLSDGGMDLLKKSEHFGVTVSGEASFYYDKDGNLIMIRVASIGSDVSDGRDVSVVANDDSAWVSELRLNGVSEEAEHGVFDVPDGYKSVDEATYMAEEEAIWSGQMVVGE